MRAAQAPPGGCGGSLAPRAAVLKKRKEQEAIAAMEREDGSMESMLRPLIMLRQAGHGGQVLKVCQLGLGRPTGWAVGLLLEGAGRAACSGASACHSYCLFNVCLFRDSIAGCVAGVAELHPGAAAACV